MKLELINKKLLEESIESLERGYVECVVTEVQTPVFIALCEEEKQKTADAERIKSLDETIDAHKKNLSVTLESMKSLEEIIPNLKQLWSQL